MNRFQFRIAGLTVELSIAWPVSMTDNFRPFLSDFPEAPEEKVEMNTLEALPPLSEPIRWETDCVGRSRTGDRPCILRRMGRLASPYSLEIRPARGEQRIWFLRDVPEIPGDISRVFSCLALENMLLDHQILLLHSSFICWKETGILFSAPSGTGKSTQADLWARYEGADILNGDRAAIRQLDGRWTAYGIPMAGSSDIFRNESAPIRAIVYLSQGPENILTPLTPVGMFRKIYPEFTLHRWESESAEKGTDLILKLLSQVPCYGLSCRPDREAVTLLRDTLTNEVMK